MKITHEVARVEITEAYIGASSRALEFQVRFPYLFRSTKTHIFSHAQTLSALLPLADLRVLSQQSLILLLDNLSVIFGFSVDRNMVYCGILAVKDLSDLLERIACEDVVSTDEAVRLNFTSLLTLGFWEEEVNDNHFGNQNYNVDEIEFPCDLLESDGVDPLADQAGNGDEGPAESHPFRTELIWKNFRSVASDETWPSETCHKVVAEDQSDHRLARSRVRAFLVDCGAPGKNC